MNQRIAGLLAAVSFVLLAGCIASTVPSAAPPSAAALLPAGIEQADYVLLGEVHDNADQHALRLQWLQRLASQRGFVLAMEQFDLNAQPVLDAAFRAGAASGVTSAQERAAQARALAERAGFRFEGWDWKHYGPVVEFALAQNIALFAANLPAREVMAVARGTGGTTVKDPSGWAATDRNALEAIVREGHCNLLPEAMLAPMARAQQARDAAMAAAMVNARRASSRPVVLLAGNGHVRADLGVPRYLRDLDPGAKVVAIGLLERSTDSRADRGNGQYDSVVMTAPVADRPDPCESLRKRFAPK